MVRTVSMEKVYHTRISHTKAKPVAPPQGNLSFLPIDKSRGFSKGLVRGQKYAANDYPDLARQYLAACAARSTSDQAIGRGAARDSVTSSAADSRRSATRCRTAACCPGISRRSDTVASDARNRATRPATPAT